MMLNKVILQGRLTANPELKVTTSGLSVTTFSLAVDQRDRERDAYFFNVVAWRNTAKFICSHFGKGDGIGIDGHLTSRSYEKDGVKRTVYEIVADQVFFTEGRKQSDGQGVAYDPATNQIHPVTAPVPVATPEMTGFTEMSDDGELPF